MPRHRKSNRNKRLASEESISQSDLDKMARDVKYNGSPMHKRHPGDFGLTPPAAPRQGKSLCDEADVLKRKDAVMLPQEGLRRGVVSANRVDGWPKQVWAVTQKGVALEAQCSGAGTYHGYPMALSDPFRKSVLEFWRERDA